MFTKKLVLALGLGVYFAPVGAYFVMPCPGRLVRERLDPIVNPGKVSGHVHTISGGSAFAADYTYGDTRTKAKCSSCTIKQDMSNYWTPQLYVKNKDGTFTAVPSRGDGDDSTGGMKVYYFYGTNDNTQPFPEDFRMLAGDPFKRNDTGDITSKALTYYCDGGNLPKDTYGLPNVNCAGYLKIQFLMPNCWTGVDPAPPGGKGHVSYYKGDNPRNGDCPAEFPVRLPQLFYEVEYDTGKFADQWVGNQHPFVFAQGDETGYGFHGDFVNGWDIDVLGKAIKGCTSDPNGNIGSCSVLSEYEWDECRSCKVPDTVNEDAKGPTAKLPGCNPPTAGPESAQPVTNCDDAGQLGAGATDPSAATEQQEVDNPPSTPTTMQTSTKVVPQTKVASQTKDAMPTKAPHCPHFNCMNQVFMSSSLAKPFCATYTQGTTTEAKAIPTFLNNCGGKAEDVSSACTCLAVPTAYLNS